MKKLVLLIVAVWATFFSIAQNPDFRFPVYFEDYVGNQDTIVVGYDFDVSVEHHLYNPALGEDSFKISTPFDSIFNVWILGGSLANRFYQTIHIGGYEGDCTLGGSFFELRVRNKKRPLKVSWSPDSLLMGTSPICHGKISFFANESWALVWPYEDYGKYLQEISPPEFEEDYVQQFGEFNIVVEKKNIVGGGQDTVYRSFILMQSGEDSNTNESEKEKNNWLVFPNPCQNWVTIRPPIPDYLRSNMELFDASGRQVFLPAFFSNDAVLFETEKLPTGLYFLKIQPKKGPPILQKFMVAR